MKKTILFAFALTALIATTAFAQTDIDDIEVINIENKAVQDYMADKTYETNSNYAQTVINKYNKTAIYGKKLYWPNGKEVRWEPSTSAANIAEIRITVSENVDFTDSVTHNPDSKDVSSFVIRNTIPNRIYYYKVEEILNSGEVRYRTDGVFRTIGQVRMIQVRNCGNVRDLGGWPTQYGKPVKYGYLYRSASLDRITPEGRHDFAGNLNVGAELDLRSESRLKQSRLGSDKGLLVLPHNAGLAGLRDKKYVYVKDLRFLSEYLKKGVAVDWHCAIGCDRCGAVSFLIEGLLGMSEIDLCRDFELSTLSLSEKNLRPRSHISSMMKYIKNFGEPDNLAQCFYNYWLSLGVDKEELNWFIRTILDVDDEQIAATLQLYEQNDTEETEDTEYEEVR